MLNAQTIRSNAARQAYGFQVGAAAQTGQASEDIFAGNQAATAGDIGAGADLLKGVGQAGQLLGGSPNTPSQNYAAQQITTGSALNTSGLPTNVGGGYGVGTAINWNP
jgi:hypothetical protein